MSAFFSSTSSCTMVRRKPCRTSPLASDEDEEEEEEDEGDTPR